MPRAGLTPAPPMTGGDTADEGAATVSTAMPGSEHTRIKENTGILPPWWRWGPYVSERAWGTVREDYSPDGDAWRFLSHDLARSKAFRWGEDGLAGICIGKLNNVVLPIVIDVTYLDENPFNP